jgi:DMSO/TMAO reductase YedYZ molybdopterin-dependent catalytic subunit
MFIESKESRARKEKELEMKREGRLPPGQALTLKWPVLHLGDVPRFDPYKWDFRIFGAVEEIVQWNYQEFMKLPKVQIKSDFHCVTRWSRFDNVWEGIAFSEVMKQVRLKKEANHVLMHGESSYTANAPLVDLMQPNVLFAYKNNEENLTPEHGWPLRLIVPHLYAWKSVKWVRGLEFLTSTVPGFWEQNGYHIYADPFREQRYTDD